MKQQSKYEPFGPVPRLTETHDLRDEDGFLYMTYTVGAYPEFVDEEKTLDDAGIHGLALQQCTLLTESEWSSLEPGKFPIGVNHADDGVLTPDGYSWGHSLMDWFAVHFAPGVNAMQIMSRSRLAVALQFLGLSNRLI